MRNYLLSQPGAALGAAATHDTAGSMASPGHREDRQGDQSLYYFVTVSEYYGLHRISTDFLCLSMAMSVSGTKRENVEEQQTRTGRATKKASAVLLAS